MRSIIEECGVYSHSSPVRPFNLHHSPTLLLLTYLLLLLARPPSSPSPHRPHPRPHPHRQRPPVPPPLPPPGTTCTPFCALPPSAPRGTAFVPRHLITIPDLVAPPTSVKVHVGGQLEAVGAPAELALQSGLEKEWGERSELPCGSLVVGLQGLSARLGMDRPRKVMLSFTLCAWGCAST